MNRSFAGMPLMALAAALSITCLAPASPAPAYISMTPAASSHLVHVDENAHSLSREGARILRRDRHSERRGEPYKRLHRGRYEPSRKFAGQGPKGHRLAHRGKDRRYGYNDRPDRQYLYQFGTQPSLHRYRDERRERRHGYVHRHDNPGQFKGYGRKPRSYRMHSFDYSTRPAKGPLKDILTAVPD